MRIAHLADIHISSRRRDEYAVVFGRLYDSLREQRPDIIAVVGDVFDNKNHATAENFNDVREFLTNLTEIAPVVMIAGNHDTNIRRPGALDLLTVLVEDNEFLRPPALHYWRNSGVYQALGCEWHVKAADGEMPPGGETPVVDGPRVFLFHEEVRGARLPAGALWGDAGLSADTFSRFDLSMGGHIHLRQVLAVDDGGRPKAAYCGSLVQQNIGESHTGHGYVLWTREPAGHWSFQGIDLYNDRGFVVLRVNGQECTERPLPTAPRYWDVIAADTAPADLSQIVEQYTAVFGSVPRSIDCGGPGPANGGAAGGPSDLRAAQRTAASVDEHAAIIAVLLGANHQHLAQVQTMHKEMMQTTARPGGAGGRLRLKRLEFDNFYKFGEKNVVEFERLEGGVSGAVAPNRFGKSSLIEIVLFALYDKHPRCRSKKDMVRSHATSCWLGLDFELDGKQGRIEKGMLGSSKDTTSQYRLTYDGENLTGGGTAETLRSITHLLGGNADIALATSFQLQDCGHEFVECEPAARKALMAGALALGRFTDIEKIATKQVSELNGEIRALSGLFRGTPLAALIEAEEECRLRIARLRAAQATLAADAQSRAQQVDLLGEVLPIQPPEPGWEAQLELARQHGYPCDSDAQDAGRPVAFPDWCQARLLEEQLAVATDAAMDRAGYQALLDIAQSTALRLGVQVSRLGFAEAEPPVPTECRPADARLKEWPEVQTMAWPEPGAVADAMRAMSDPLPLGEPADWDAVPGATRARLMALDGATLDKVASAPCDTAVSVLPDAKLRQAGIALLAGVCWSPECPGCADAQLRLDSSKDAEVLAAHNKVLMVRAARALRARLASERRASATGVLGRAAFMQRRDAEYQARYSEWKDRASAWLAGRRAELQAMLESAPPATRAQLHEQTRRQVQTACWAAAQSRRALAAEAALARTSALRAARDAERASRRLLEENAKALGSADGQLLTTSAARAAEEQRSAALAEATCRFEVLDAYRKVISPKGGIADQLLERAREELQRGINQQLRVLGAGFELAIEPDFSLTHTDPAQNASLDARLASGYQKFAMSLAARLVMWECSAVTLPDAMFLDEGFKSCDQANLQSLGDALEVMGQKSQQRDIKFPRLVFIVTHLEELKAVIDRPIFIESGTVSTIRNGEPSDRVVPRMRQKTAPTTCNTLPPMPAAGPNASYDMVAMPDGTTWCPACDKSFTAARVKTHLGSKTHANAIEQKRKRLVR